MRLLTPNRLEDRHPHIAVFEIDDSDAREASDAESALSNALALSWRLVLVVADDPHLRMQLVTQLEQMGCCSCCVPDGHAALKATRGNSFHLVMVDAGLPGKGGITLVRQLRRDGCSAPIVVMVSSQAELAAALALEPMADDCLIKPFSALDLAARIAGVLRRAPRPQFDSAGGWSDTGLIRVGDVMIDPCRRHVEVRGDPVTLTAKEFNLLSYLAGNPGRVFTRAELLDRIWGLARDVYEHTVNSHINRLRSKIERDPANPDYIQTVWGVGYRFAGPQS